MDYGLIDLPQTKWGSGTGRQVVLKGDFAKLEASILQALGLLAPPELVYIDGTSVKVPATADCIAATTMLGIPNPFQAGTYIGAGLTDGRYRENTADVVCDFDLAADRWGTEKVSQYYAFYAIAGNADTTFTLKAMPIMRVKSQAGQVISLGTNITPGTGIGYGFTTDSLVGYKILFMSGASKGLVRTISANNNDDGTGGTITYSGDSLSMAAGDWFIILPNTNFRWLLNIFNNPSSNLTKIAQYGDRVDILDEFSSGVSGGVNEIIQLGCPMAVKVGVEAVGTGVIGHWAGSALHAGWVQLDAQDQNNYFEVAYENCKLYATNCTLYAHRYMYKGR